MLKKYAVGEKFYSNRAMLEQTVSTFLRNAPEDKLPGIDAARLEILEEAFERYNSVEVDQSTAQVASRTDRSGLAAMVLEIGQRRREIQRAADRAWPHTKAVNAPIRREFRLPSSKPMR